MGKIVSSSQLIAYLRALAETGNASLAAARAGVSRDWAYKKRKADERFDGLCREMVERFREMPVPPHPPTADAAGPSLSQEGRGVKRVQVRRPRKGGWTPEAEQRFLAALAATCDVPLAASSAGLTAPSAYRHRPGRPGFAFGWAKALRRGRAMLELDWVEAAECFFEGRAAPDDNPVRVTGIGEVLRMLARVDRVRRRRGKE